MLKAETSSIPEESKLRHSDDYRGKIVHDKDRFQDKVHEKVSKRNTKIEPNGNTSKRNAKYRASDKGSVNEAGKADYDPLGQDLDNDGIIDRYDNDFRDSDYFESTYDVEDNLPQKEKSLENQSKNHKAQKNKYKRKNYSESLYTRKRTMYQKRISLKVKRRGKMLQAKRKYQLIKRPKEKGQKGYGKSICPVRACQRK